MDKMEKTVLIAEDKKSAVITFDNGSFDKFLGEELKKAHDTIMSKAGEYVQSVTTDGYTEAGKLFAENEDIIDIDIEAPIFRDGDRFQAHVNRTEIDLVSGEDYVPAIKITQSITSADNLRGGVRTMASTYQEIMANKNK